MPQVKVTVKVQVADALHCGAKCRRDHAMRECSVFGVELGWDKDAGKFLRCRQCRAQEVKPAAP